MKQKNVGFKDFLIPTIEIVLVVLTFVFFSDLVEVLNSDSIVAISGLVIIPIYTIAGISSVIFNIIGIIVAFRNYKPKILKIIQIAILIANSYLLYQTITILVL